MNGKKLSLKESRKLVWFTWLEFLIVGVMVYSFTDPLSAWVLLAVPIAFYALVNFWVNSEYVPVKVYSVVPSVFLPTAFFTGIGALVLVLIKDQIMNSYSLALATVCAMCFMVIYPESRYSN